VSDTPEAEVPYDGSERRFRGPTEPRVGWPRWVLALGLVLAYVAVMVPIGFIVVYAHRSDGRAERAGRTVCELSVALNDLATSFDRTITLLPDPIKGVADGNLRKPITDAQHAARAAHRCQTGPDTER
jgi:hypothetical protein